MQYVDCDRAEKNGNLCLGYGYEEIDEPCEQCQNCIKCESGTYQLGETEKDDQLTKAKHYIKELVRAVESSYSVLSWQRPPIKAEAEQFLKDIKES